MYTQFKICLIPLMRLLPLTLMDALSFATSHPCALRSYPPPPPPLPPEVSLFISHLMFNVCFSLLPYFVRVFQGFVLSLFSFPVYPHAAVQLAITFLLLLFRFFTLLISCASVLHFLLSVRPPWIIHCLFNMGRCKFLLNPLQFPCFHLWLSSSQLS